MRANESAVGTQAPKMLVAVWLVGVLRILVLTKGMTLPSALMIS